MNTGTYDHIFEHYPANEHLELSAFQGALLARSTLPYVKLLNAGDIFRKKALEDIKSDEHSKE